MPILAAALFAGLTAMAVVPGAEGPVPRRAAPAPAAPPSPKPAPRRLAVGPGPCDQVQDDPAPPMLLQASFYGEIAEYSWHLLDELVEVVRAWAEPEPGLAL